MKYSFENNILPVLNNAIKVDIDPDYIIKIESHVKELIKTKKNESHHIIDNKNEFGRFFNGYLGEAAIEKLLGIKIIDWTIGDSSIYHVPDIPGYNVGIKTCRYGSFPIIFKSNDYSQIICIINQHNKGSVYVCGLATPDVLNEYQDDDLISFPQLKVRGTKTGFYGLDHLIPIRSLNDISKYRKTVFRKVEGVNYKRCPECGRPMTLRTGKFGSFWGCTGYPDCRHTERI